MEDYRYLATSCAGFVQQVVTGYVARGYWFHVSGRVRPGKNAAAIDAKLIERYGIGGSRSSRWRRKKRGLANVHYIRFDDHWLMLATRGEHHWFQEEAANIRDVRRSEAIHFHGYSISLKPGLYRPHRAKLDRDGPPERDSKLRVRVQIGRESLRELRGEFLSSALRLSAGAMAKKFFNVPFEPYAPVRQQMLRLLRQVNKVRKSAGRQLLTTEVIRYRRNLVKPFELQGNQAGGNVPSQEIAEQLVLK